MSLLIDTAVRISIIVVVALGLTLMLRHRSAALRHWVLTIAIGCGAAMPLLHLVLPAWRIGLAPFPSAVAVPQQPSTVTASVVVRDAPLAHDRSVDTSTLKASNSSFRLPLVILTVWLAGAVIGLVTLVVGWSRLSRIASRARVVSDGRLCAAANDIRQALGLRHPVMLLQSSESTVLGTWGVRRPTVILPADATAWRDDRARIVLRHELAHVARGDWLVQMVAETLRAVYWFNPLLWISSRLLRHEGERACDDAVLNAGIEPADYASHLLDLARRATQPRVGPVLAMARASSLEGRVSAMLNGNISRRPVRNATRIATLAAFAAITVTVAVAQNRYWTFSGTVIDATNRVVPDSTLVLTNQSTRAKHEVRSDPAGRFEFVGLPSGRYRLAVEHPGFSTSIDAVTIDGRDLARTIRLKIGSVQETIRVVGGPSESPQLDPEQQARREAARRRGAELLRRASEKCAAGPTAGELGGQILPPVKLTHVRPDYPESLQAAGIGGVVTLHALIGTDGTVREVTGISSPHPDLERAAIDAVHGWQFSTTYLNCTPVEVPMRVTVNFVTP